MDSPPRFVCVAVFSAVVCAVYDGCLLPCVLRPPQVRATKSAEPTPAAAATARCAMLNKVLSTIARMLLQVLFCFLHLSTVRTALRLSLLVVVVCVCVCVFVVCVCVCVRACV